MAYPRRDAANLGCSVCQVDGSSIRDPGYTHNGRTGAQGNRPARPPKESETPPERRRVPHDRGHVDGAQEPVGLSWLGAPAQDQPEQLPVATVRTARAETLPAASIASTPS